MNEQGAVSEAGGHARSQLLAERLEPRDLEAFRGYLADAHRKIGPLFVYFVMLALLGWWPLDDLLFGAGTVVWERFFSFRWQFAVGVGSVSLLALLAGQLDKRPFALCTLVMAAGWLHAGYHLGMLGRDADIWFGFLYVAPLFAVFVPAFLQGRLLLTGAIAVAGWGGYWLGFPEFVGSPKWGMLTSFLLFCAALAVVMGHVVFGLMLSNFSRERRLAEQESSLRELAQTLQERVAAQTAQLRQLMKHLETSREEERRWMARELHDELGQEIAALRLAVAFGQRAPSPGQAAVALNDVDSLLDRMHDTLRRLLSALRPKVLDELGISGALRWLAEQTQERHGLNIRVEVANDCTLEPETAAALFRVAQEALTNVVRHAQAGSVHISFAAASSEAILQVCDNGVGFSLGGQEGFGLPGIRERMGLLGGHAEWVSGCGQGCTLIARVPLMRREV